MIDRDYCRLLVQYNAWMNAKLYAAAAQLTDGQRREDRRAFFKSIHGTLNHVLYADLLWLYRFTDRPTVELHPDDGLADEFSVLRTRRTALDAELSTWVETLSADWLSADFSYFSKAYGAHFTRPAWTLVVHLFNHQTHHRGQLTTLLTQLGVEPGVTDLPLVPALARAD